MSTRSTHTYVILDVSPAAYREIGDRLRAAGYDHVFHDEEGHAVIDMHGIAVAEDNSPAFQCCPFCGQQWPTFGKPGPAWCPSCLKLYPAALLRATTQPGHYLMTAGNMLIRFREARLVGGDFATLSGALVENRHAVHLTGQNGEGVTLDVRVDQILWCYGPAEAARPFAPGVEFERVDH